jgi:hypothetical protein
MSDSTRRNFLIASGAGAAAVGVAAAIPGSASASTPKAAAPATVAANAKPLVAHVSDPSTGTVSVFSGEHEVVVHDPELVARLTRAAHNSTKEA